MLSRMSKVAVTVFVVTFTANVCPINSIFAGAVPPASDNNASLISHLSPGSVEDSIFMGPLPPVNGELAIFMGPLPPGGKILRPSRT
jgi:hypothetical protein